MSINALNPTIQAIQSMAAQASGNINENGAASGALSFSDAFQDSLRKVNGAQQNAAAKNQAYQLGDPNVSLNEVMVDMQKASLGFQMTVQVRNKLVSAYKDIMSMQV